MGSLGADGPCYVLTALFELIFLLMFSLDKLWGNTFYFVRGVVTAAKGERASWSARIRNLSAEPTQQTGQSNPPIGAEMGEAPINYVASVGGLAYPSGMTELLERVSRVRETLPDDVGIVAVDGVLLEASTVRELAESAKFCEYVVIVGPCCVATSYQVGLISIDAFSVVEDLTPERAVVHPLVHRMYNGEWSLVQVVLRFVVSIVTLVVVVVCGMGSGINVSGFPVTSIIVFALNLAARVVLRPDAAQAVPSSELYPKGAAVAPLDVEEALESTKETEADASDQWVAMVRAKPDLSLPEVLTLSFPGALYGLSALSLLPGWIRWILLIIGSFSSILFSTSGCLHSRLTGSLSPLIYPAFALAWMVYFAGALVLSPVCCVIVMCIQSSFEGGNTIPQLLALVIFTAWPLVGVVLGIAAMAGHLLVPVWGVCVACAGLLPGTIFVVLVEVAMLGEVNCFDVQNKVTGDLFPRFPPYEYLDENPYDRGYKHEKDTGLNVRYVPLYVKGAPHGVSVINCPGDVAGTCWRWAGGESRGRDEKQNKAETDSLDASSSESGPEASSTEPGAVGSEGVFNAIAVEPILDAQAAEPVLDALGGGKGSDARRSEPVLEAPAEKCHC